MSDLVSIQPTGDDASRRDLLKGIAVLAALGTLPAEAAQQVHHHVHEEKKANSGPYKPKALKDHEYRTLQRLTDLIIPADEKSPGALEAGAADFIDYMCSVSPEMLAIYTGGLAWMDRTMEKRHEKPFMECSPAQQTTLLDLIAYRKNATNADLGAGINFFDWVRRMTADAYYTSKIGTEDVGFKGNVGMPVFKVPQEAIDYALKRSPV